MSSLLPPGAGPGDSVTDELLQQAVWKVRDDGICDVTCPPDNYTVSLTDPHLCHKCVDSCPKGLITVSAL